MGEQATAGDVSAGGNIGEFHLDAADGAEWTYRMYLHGADMIVVHRAHPDPDNGRNIATAEDLNRYEIGKTRFDFPSEWSANGNAVLAEGAIIDAYKRATEVRSSIRFGDLVLVMTTALGKDVVRVEEEPDAGQPRWAATLTAPHRDYMSVQVSWSGPDYGHVFGTDPEADPGRSNRLRLALAGSALWRSTNRSFRALPRQACTDDINDRFDLLNA